MNGRAYSNEQRPHVAVPALTKELYPMDTETMTPQGAQAHLRQLDRVERRAGIDRRDQGMDPRAALRELFRVSISEHEANPDSECSTEADYRMAMRRAALALRVGLPGWMLDAWRRTPQEGDAS